MPQPLTPVGFDSQFTAQSLQPPQASMAPDTTGLQTLNQATQQSQQTLQADSQAAAMQAKAVQDIATSQAQSAQMVSQSAAQSAQANATRSSSNLQSFGNLADTVLKTVNRYNDYQIKKDEATAKAQYELEKTAPASSSRTLRSIG